jgi:hypothetical protein
MSNPKVGLEVDGALVTTPINTLDAVVSFVRKPCAEPYRRLPTA